MNHWPETDDEQQRLADWQVEVGNGDTVLGFRDWIAHQEAAEHGAGAGAGGHPYAGAVTWESNCTEGLMCPRCGATGTFTIVDAHVTCTVTDGGVDEYEGCEYEPTAAIQCYACGHNGTVAHFALPDGPTWNVDPATGSVTALVPSPRALTRAAVTVTASGEWEVYPLDSASAPRLFGGATDVDRGREAALAAWRDSDMHRPL